MIREFWVIDPGTSHTVLATDPGGAIHREPSLVALLQPKPGRSRMGRILPAGLRPTKLLQTGRARVVGVGREAAQIPDGDAENVHWVWPVNCGVMNDPYAMELVLQQLIDKRPSDGLRKWITRKKVGLLLSPALADEERLKFFEVVRSLGFGRVVLIDAHSAAVAGCGLDITHPSGRMVIDIGGGKSSLTAFSMGGATLSHEVPFGGGRLDEAVQNFVLARFRLHIGLHAARWIKETLGSVYPRSQAENVVITGTDTSSGIEKKVTLDDNELRDVLVDSFESLLMGIQQAFENITPELSSDIAQSEILLIGGGARLSGLAVFLSERTGLIFTTPSDPINTVVRGGLALLREGRVDES